MKQILPGLWHWTRVHEKIRIPVHSYYLEGARVLIDPMVPKEGLEWFRKHGPPEHALLTNRHHYRHSARFRRAFGLTVHCHRAGLHEFRSGQKVTPFEFGARLPGGTVALKVAVLCPEETAFGVPRAAWTTGSGAGASGDGHALAFGDALIRGRNGRLGFVPDAYMGEDAEGVKRGLRTAFRRLAKKPFAHLLMAHGQPLVGRGKLALARFAAA
jgi:hypothetical protein